MTYHDRSAAIRKGAAALVALVLLAVFIAQAGYLRFGTSGGPSFAEVNPRELLFWLAHLFLAFPAVLIIARSVDGRIGLVLHRRAAEAVELRGREAHIAVAAFGVCLFLLYLLGRSILLLDLPVTDDENAVTFGARIMAAGRLSVPEPQPQDAFPLLYVFREKGLISSMDFPGIIAFRALTLRLPLGEALYAGVSAVTGALVVAAAGRAGGGRAQVFAALLWALSPMAMFLSMTTHGHILSRGFLALAIWAWVSLSRPSQQSPSRWIPFTIGVGLGAAFLCRPIESAAIGFPLVVDITIKAIRSRKRAPLAIIFATIAPFLALFATYNHALVGTWYLPARHAPGASGYVALETLSLAARLATNTGQNALYLVQLFATPLMFIPVIIGARKHASVGFALAAGAVLQLATSLAHENIGIHTVGPIHYSELSVNLTILAAMGLSSLHESLRDRLGAVGDTWIRQVVVALGLALVIFDAIHGLSLRRLASVQSFPFEFLKEAGVSNAVVLAPPPIRLYLSRPELAGNVPWVLSFPNPDPFFRDDIVFAAPDCNVAELRSRFPDRAVFRMTYHRSGIPVQLESLLPQVPAPDTAPVLTPPH